MPLSLLKSKPAAADDAIDNPMEHEPYRLAVEKSQELSAKLQTTREEISRLNRDLKGNRPPNERDRRAAELLGTAEAIKAAAQARSSLAELQKEETAIERAIELNAETVRDTRVVADRRYRKSRLAEHKELVADIVAALEPLCEAVRREADFRNRLGVDLGYPLVFAGLPWLADQGHTTDPKHWITGKALLYVNEMKAQGYIK